MYYIVLCVCVCVLLTGGVIDPLDVCWRIFLKVSKDVLCAHVVHTCYIDRLHTQSGDS